MTSKDGHILIPGTCECVVRENCRDGSTNRTWFDVSSFKDCGRSFAGMQATLESGKGKGTDPIWRL